MSLLLLSVVSFVLHLGWERLHLPLYTGYEALEGMMPVFIYASFGDLLYTLGAISLIAIYKQNATWFLEARGRDYATLSVLGLCIALFVEYKARYFDRWEYTDAMPLVPFLDVGLSPIVQMTVLLPLSVFCTIRLYKRLFLPL